ncbi:MAG: glycosyltransferase [Planctomycetes bacterium]|jgi:glycosyltransferase involved in cell wall biosynthesis|nr:glycosyltransferase [Planctomycetota bacterium]
MTNVVHLIDAETPADATEQMLALRTDEQPVICLGPPPAHTALPEVRSIHRPGGNSAGAARWVRRALPLGARVHAWSLAPAIAAVHGQLATVLSLSDATPLETLEPMPWSLARLRCPVTVPTEAMRQTLIDAGLNADTVTLLPPATAPDADRADARRGVRERFGLSPEAVVLAAPSELTAAAQHRLVCWAQAICHHAGSTAELLVPGSGPRQRNIEYFAATTGFGAHMHVCGPSLGRRDALAAADIAAFADSAPAGATILAEALAAGLPTIATRAADSTGLLGPAAVRLESSAPQPLARELLRLLDDADARAQLARRAVAHATETLGAEVSRHGRAEIYSTLP